MGLLRDRMGDRMDDYAFPPPVFETMQGEFVALELDAGTLSTRFPVVESYLNPYGTMQGGMVAAAIDNTLGPLSVLLAPPNVTRRLELKYSHPVTLDMGHIIVHAKLLERKGQWLYFRADVHSREGLRLAMAKATHWIIEDEVG
jgi:acyl-coenzyme A thioesterase PaaI-like protein